MPDGSANLAFIEAVAKSIAKYVSHDIIVVTKVQFLLEQMIL